MTTTTAASTTTVAGDSPRRSAQQEVEAAYLRSWEVYAEAMLRLDPARLQDVYSGPALATRRNEIADLARLGTPGLIRVDHDYEIVLVNADAALVLENYFNHSVLLDGTTMQPIESDPNATVKREYVLERRNDDWRITRINVGS